MNKNILTIIVTVLAIAGCRKKDDLFAGSDAIIASFQLLKEQQVYKGTVRNDSIIVHASFNANLTGAKATVQLSELATIQPDPATISNWDETVVLEVKAHNGYVKKYTYYVERAAAVYNGDLVLTSQDAVDAVAAEKIAVVNGNLIIGSTKGTDSIISLEALKTITSVMGALQVLPTYGGVDLAGLDNVKKVQSLLIGGIRYNAADADMKLRSVSLPALEEVLGNFDINLLKVKTIAFPKLHTAGNEFFLSQMDSLESISFPELKEVYSLFNMQGNSVENKLKEISFPKLEKVAGNFYFANWMNLTKLNFPLLTETVDFRVTGFPKLEDILFPSLKMINGRMDLSSLPALKNLNTEKLELVIGNLVWDNLPVTSLDRLQSLKQVNGIVSFYFLNEVTNINGLKNLSIVGNGFTMYSFPKLNDPELAGLSSLKEVGGTLNFQSVPFKKYKPKLRKVRMIDISGGDIEGIEEIDISEVTDIEIFSLRNIDAATVVKGKDDLSNCQLFFESSNVSLQGFKKIKQLSFNVYEGTTVTLSGIEEVLGNATVNLYGITAASFPDLRYVGGLLNMSIYSDLTLSIPKLDSAGRITADVAMVNEFQLPTLKKVSGDFTIVYGSDGGMIETMGFPKLTTVEGTLLLRAAHSSYKNTKLTNLNAFSNLQKAGAVSISQGASLSDFSAFEKVIKVLNAGTWTTANNLYNPTYDDMVAGRFTKAD